MSAYTDNAAIEPLREADGRWSWELAAPLSWEVGHLGSGLSVTAAAGFETDLASIPRWAKWLFNPYDPATAKAAIIHDCLLAQGWEQRAAAGEFYSALAADRVTRLRRIVYFLAVLAASSNW